MKFSRKSIQSKTYSFPEIEFKNQSITSYSGVVLLQALIKKLNLKETLSKCFNHMSNNPTYDNGLITLILITHIFLGYRKIKDSKFYQDDPLVLRSLGLNQLPDASTITRRLSEMDIQSADKLRSVLTGLVLQRLEDSQLKRITLDFDGSVLSTGKRAEGSAVGYNKVKKGQRSYYPLYCTIAQTGQVFDFLHRPGNVHDSKGAKDFILSCIRTVKNRVKNAIVEVRMDSAFFSEETIKALIDSGIEFTISVPFARYTELKEKIEARKWWRRFDRFCGFFESKWSPKKWSKKCRFIFIRQESKLQQKGPIQLDMFEPISYEYKYKVIVTNKSIKTKKVVRFHEGRGYQENIFSELKSQSEMDYIPTKKLAGNQVFLISTIMAHNLNREMQMIACKPNRGTTEKRTPLWVFEKIDTIRKNFIQRSGKLTWPKGKLMLTLNANKSVERGLVFYMKALID